MVNQAREERGEGVPLDDVQRLMRHYNVTYEEACALLAVYSVDELLPERGYGLTAANQIVGYTMVNQAREERGEGVPLDDVQRLMRHYNVTYEEACALLAVYSVDELLPERGYGLTVANQIVGYTAEDLRIALDAMEQSIPLGAKVRVEIYTDRMPAEENLAEAFIRMTASGAHMSYPTTKLLGGVPTVSFELQKGSPAFALAIPLIVPLLTIGLIFFVVTKIETIAKALFPILILGVTGVVVLAGIARSERLGTKYLEQRYSPSTLPKVLAAR